MTDLVAQLQSKGVEVRPKITRTGLVQGLSYSLDGVAFQGAHLQGCSFPKLQARGVNYERERDLPALTAVARGGKLTVEIEVDFTPEVEPNQQPDDGYITIQAFVVEEKSESQSQSRSCGLSM